MMGQSFVVFVLVLVSICMFLSHSFKMSMSTRPQPKSPAQIQRTRAVYVAQNLLGASALLTLSRKTNYKYVKQS